ncbi:MAG: hypothetical protein GOMPHAMPRED_000014 [Gomphillus americanus]|uniref:PRP1 splicing factor N-terminal domain-containing protein n=1 Tax=Gomphillus americanus TaxID=1940652 RepID=A0A8H3ECT1_9LECA|nr:MAG: hypothetical protein GOMPHAMPRED_000014 [Gomphillus americanus]
MSGRKDFLSQPAPDNYVAGLGRGATGFTTRSDLGPAREGPSDEQMKELLTKRAQQLGTALPTAYGAPDKKPEEDDNDERYQNPDDEVGLFANGVYDQDDDEADRIWQSVDEKREKRRKKRREVQEQLEREEEERKHPKISAQFSDLKRSLAAVTDDEWQNLPEVGDLTRKNKRAKQARDAERRFYAVPDSVIASARDSTQLDTKIHDEKNGTETVDGTMTNFAAIGAARDKVLQVRLDQAAQNGTESVIGTATSIDPKSYESALMNNEDIPVGDVKRVRPLLESLLKTNPKYPRGWITAARLEEVAGKTVAARNVIARGCEMCPKSEDVWIESIRLNDNHNAKIIAANAIKNNDTSVRLWTEAMRLESDSRSKKRVLRRALDHLPTSVALWKEAVNLEEDPQDARFLLAKATELIPLSVELWLALARLETPENAQKVLNKARQAVPNSHEVYVAGARLQEQMGKPVTIMGMAIRGLIQHSAMLKREEWITEAEKCEEEGAILTCAAIIRETLGYGLDEDDDRKEIWLDDAKQSINRERYGTARAIFAYALQVFFDSRTVWAAAADLEKNHGSREALWALLGKAVEACPQSDALWLQLAREKWNAGHVDDARKVLFNAFNQNPNNEDIWLAAVKLEADSNDFDKARRLLQTARDEAGTARVWIKSVAFERNTGRDIEALDLVTQGLQLYPSAAKLWMQKGQIYTAMGKIPQAREAYATGTRACPKSVPLWLLFARLETQAGNTVKARSVLERARLDVPKNAELWTESARIERKAGNVAQAKKLMAQALQEVPNSGLLWTENIMYLEPRTQRKPLSLAAIKKADNDSLLFTTVARIFWSERKLDKAASWFERAILIDSDNGDAWAWYTKFLSQHGTEEKKTSVREQCLASEPKHGEIWAAVAKDPALRSTGKNSGICDILDLVVERLEE